MKTIAFVFLAVLSGSFSNLATASSIEQLPSDLVSREALESKIDSLDAQSYSAAFHYYIYECYARGDHGGLYWGRSRFPYRAEQNALLVCFRYNRHCYSEGCRAL